MKILYSDEFYATRDAGTRYFTERLAHIVNNLFEPKSVVDLGCGVGTLAAAFKTVAGARVLGVEGPWVDASKLVIEEDEILCTDLSKPLPSDVGKFDIACSLEVAEHLPPDHAEAFVDTLVGLSPVVVFSAAIPYQGGIGHQNECWQSYWAQHFLNRGYRVADLVRPLIWGDEKISPWYKQNTLIYLAPSAQEHLADHLLPIDARLSTLDLVHPETFLAERARHTVDNIAYRDMISALPGRTLNVLRSRFGSKRR